MILLSLVMGCCLQQQSAPALTTRNAPAADATSLDARIAAPVQIPVEASGEYVFDRGRDTVEVDFGPEGMSGYMSVAPMEKGEVAPVTLFFETSTIGGEHVHFLTHEVHRTRYEFDGDVREMPVESRSLKALFALTGMLTTHHLQPDGTDQPEQRRVTLKSERPR